MISVIIALGASATAAITIPRNSVGRPEIKQNGVGSSEIARNAVKGSDIAPGAVQTSDLSAALRNQLNSAGTQGTQGTAGPQGTPGTPGAAGAAGTSGAQGQAALTALDIGPPLFTLTSPDTGGDVGQHSSIAIGTDGNPLISHRDSTNGDLKMARCNDAACAGADETLTAVDTSANVVGLHTSIAIGTDGNPVISYYDATADDLKVANARRRR